MSDTIHPTYISSIISILIAVILIVTLMFPITQELSGTEVVTITNTGTPFALANEDSESHPIIMSVDGDELIVTSDGSPVSTGLGNVLPSVISDYKTGPFNTYYVAINLASGDNSDDAGEERLSKEKGEVAYLLNTDNLHQTAKGYTFDPTLYNVMLVIPPVYWYSEMDAPTEEIPSPTTGKLYMASSPDAFVSMGITADKLKDYAHTYTDRSDSANPVVGHAPAIAIGVYEGYNDNGVLVSQSGRTPTISSLSNSISRATAGNTDNDYGTYQLWNYYMWTLYRMMGFTIMGNMDSQYMMGAGPTGMTSSSVTGLTDSSIQKSSDSNKSVCLLIENSWGSMSEWVGDVVIENYQYTVGNALGGSTSASAVVNTLAETVTGPKSGYYTTFNPVSDAFGTASTVRATPFAEGQNINDDYYTYGSSDYALRVGGLFSETNSAGLSCAFIRDSWGFESEGLGARLAYVITDSQYNAPVGADDDYAYVMSYDVNGTIQNVQSIEDGESTSYMPTGTTLNSYWDFEPFAVLPEFSDATDSVNLAVGSDSILQFYNSGHVVLQTATGTVDLGRVNDVTPTPVTVTVQNGTLTYTGGSATINLYCASAGDYVLSDAPVKVTEDAEVWFGDYTYGLSAGTDSVDIGYVSSFTMAELGDGSAIPSVNVLAPSVAPVSTNATVDSQSSNGVTTISSITIGSTYADADSSIVYTSMFVPATFEIEQDSGGIGYELVKLVPIILILCLIVSFVIPMLKKP